MTTIDRLRHPSISEAVTRAAGINPEPIPSGGVTRWTAQARQDRVPRRAADLMEKRARTQVKEAEAWEALATHAVKKASVCRHGAELADRTRPGHLPPGGSGLPARRQPASLPSCHRHGPGPVAARPGRENSRGQFWLMGEVSVTAFNLNTEENPPGWRKSPYSFPPLPCRVGYFSSGWKPENKQPPACTYLEICIYLISTTCTWCRCLVEGIGPEYRCLVEVECRCLVVQNSPESQGFVENSPAEALSGSRSRERLATAGKGCPARVRGS